MQRTLWSQSTSCRAITSLKLYEFTTNNYHEITRIINSMKSSEPPCPVDQISIICLKWCPYLISFILNICTEVLRRNTLPTQWTKAATILIHAKGDPSLLENFRPITLEPVGLKIFTSLLGNRVFTYLIINQYIESHYQKGFMPGMKWDIWAESWKEPHYKSFKKKTTECNHYLIRPKKRFCRSSPLINPICSMLPLQTRWNQLYC